MQAWSDIDEVQQTCGASRPHHNFAQKNALERRLHWQSLHPKASKWGMPGEIGGDMAFWKRLFGNKETSMHIVAYGDNIRVWIFAEPLNAAAEAMWDKMDFIPPKTLIESADAQMKLDGMLVTAVGDNYPIDKLPKMTKEQRAACIQKEAGDFTWMCSALETELIRYNVVVIGA